MASIRFYCITVAFSILASAFPLPVGNQQSIITTCHDVSTYTTEYFLRHTKKSFAQEIEDRALFYTRNMSSRARKLACNSPDTFVTIWDVWPENLYDARDVPSNPLRCIHNDATQTLPFYENMSRAYARMARRSATVLHARADYERPPTDGIWGRIELPTLADATDIRELVKIDEDWSLEGVLRLEKTVARGVWEKAMREVAVLLRSARGWIGRGREAERERAGGGSCRRLDERQRIVLDGLF